jgi:hypothetical protein
VIRFPCHFYHTFDYISSNTECNTAGVIAVSTLAPKVPHFEICIYIRNLKNVHVGFPYGYPYCIGLHEMFTLVSTCICMRTYRIHACVPYASMHRGVLMCIFEISLYISIYA